MRFAAAILALVGACPLVAHAAPLAIEGRVSVGPSWDSNATRAVTGAGPAPDEALRLVGDLEARFAPDPRVRATAGYRGGFDDFRARTDQDRANHDLSLAATFRASDVLAPGLEGRARVRQTRDGSRDSRDATAAATLEYAPRAEASGTLRLGMRRFDFSADAYSFRGPFAGVSLRWEPLRRHELAVTYELGVRDYPGGTAYLRALPADDAFVWRDRVPAGPPENQRPASPLVPPDDPGGEDEPAPAAPAPPALGRRHDLAHAAGASWTWKGPPIVGGGYTFSRVDSNGYGLDTDRHRVHLVAGVLLPGGILASGQAALQWVRFPDGIYLADDLLLVDDEENLSSVSVRLARPLGEGLSAEVRYAAYVGSFREADLRYERQVAGAAMTYRF